MLLRRIPSAGIGCFFFLFAVLVVPVAEGIAQEPEMPAVSLTPSPLEGGLGRDAPGVWNRAAFSIENRSDKDADFLIVSFYADAPLLQFGRRVWVPAKTRRKSWYPVLPPKDISGRKVKQSQFQSTLYELSGGSESIVRAPSGQMQFSDLRRIEPVGNLTGLISHGGLQNFPYEAAVATRVAHDQSRRVVTLMQESFPTSPELIEGLSHIIISNNRLSDKIAGLLAIRRWVENGGKLWIMLDGTEPRVAQRLLGDAFSCEIVDRVSLTTVELKEVKQGDSYQSETLPVVSLREHEKPVDFLRVIVSGVEVTHTLNGWPAAFRQKLGKGDVLVTTLAPRGWLRLRTPQDPRPRSASNYTAYIPLEPLKDLTKPFYTLRAEADFSSKEFEPFLSTQIGYRILSFGGVLSVLGFFCLLLVGAGLVFYRKKRLELLGLFGPALSLIAGAVLVIWAMQLRGAIPPTVAEAQFVEVIPETGDVRLNGLLAVYNQERFEQPFGADRGGFFIPDFSSLTGSTRRMIWTDMDRWRWENAAIPPGIRTAPFQQVQSLTSGFESRAQFGPEGLSGRVQGDQIGVLKDALIATGSSNSLKVELDNDGAFTVGPENLLARGEFISETILSDEKNRRQQFYRSLLINKKTKLPLSVPTFFAWADLLNTHFHFPQVDTREGSALVSVPINVEKTPPETRVLVPSPFIRYRVLPGIGMGNENFSMPFNNRTGEWSGQAAPGRIKLRFQLPSQVLPLEIDRAVLSVRLSGPPQKLELYGSEKDKLILLDTRTRSIGTSRFVIENPDMLRLDSNGGLILGLFVGDFTPGTSSKVKIFDPRQWKIEDLFLHISGRTTAPAELSGD